MTRLGRGIPRRRAYLTVAIGFITALVWPVVALAEAKPELIVLPAEGRRGDDIDLKGANFTPGAFVDLYFSRDVADVDDSIDLQVTHYRRLVRRVPVSDEDAALPGEFRASFDLPDALDSGTAVEDVHNGDYYFYVTYRPSKKIVAVVAFSVLDGEISLAPEAATVGAEVTVNGRGLRPNQPITIEYEGERISFKGGNQYTDAEGNFTCVFVAPERPAGEYTVTASDKSGDTAEAKFNVTPRITLNPTIQGIDQSVAVSGNGFGAEERITILFETEAMPTVPITLKSNHLGGLGGSFAIPPNPRFVDGGVARVTARDQDNNAAFAELNVLPMPASINLSPATSPDKPGYVGLELRVGGVWFSPSALIDIAYDTDEVATTQSSESRYFSVTFGVPPGAPGQHTVTASDNTKSVSAVFTMERDKPPAPPPLLPATAAILKSTPHFDWEDVSDPSGVSYTLQVAADSDFRALVLEKAGLTASDYTVTDAELFRFPGRDEPYYWRVKAVDGTASESSWSVATTFYVVKASLPLGNGWLKYLWIALGAGVAVGLSVRWRKRHAA